MPRGLFAHALNKRHIAAAFHGLAVHVVHELIDQSDGNLFNLTLGSGTLPTSISRQLSTRRFASVSSITYLYYYY